MAHLVELLLPLHDNQGRVFPQELYERLIADLTRQHGGVTAHTRAPAEGSWRQKGRTTHDDIAVIEVMAERLDRDWWRALRGRLEGEFAQHEIVIRAHEIERL